MEARELYFMCKQRKIGIYLDFKICKLKDRQCFDTYSQDDWAKKETITDGMFLQNDIDMQKKMLICIIKKSKATIYTNTLIEYITRKSK